MIQARYGWTDETVKGLTFSRFFRLVRLLVTVKREEVREKMTLAAFAVYQLGAGGGKTMEEYLGSLGLMEEPERKPPDLRGGDTQVLSKMGIKVKKVKKQ